MIQLILNKYAAIFREKQGNKKVMKKFKIFILITAILFTFTPVTAKNKPVAADKLEYMNLVWWQQFDDENLDKHMIFAYENNKDLKISAAATKQAQQVVKMAFSDQLPQLTINAHAGREITAADTRFGDVLISDYSQNRFLLPLTMTYEVDIWGENYLKTKSIKQKLEMIKQDERASYIMISTALASNYYNLIKADKLIENQKNLVEIQEKIVELYEKKYDGGLCSISDVLNQKQLLTLYKEDLNNLKEKQDVLENQLKVILGDRNITNIDRTSYDKIKMIELPADIKTEAIQNRPDLIKSEYYIKRIGIDVKVARREFLPKFIVFGQVGFNAYSLSKMFGSHTFLSNIGVLPSLDLFTGGRKMAMLKYKKYEYEKALQIYEKTILTSIQEVNDSLVSAKTARSNLLHSEERFKLESEKYGLSLKKLDIGTASNLELLECKEELLLSEKANISNKIDTIISAINIYKSIGGVDYMQYEELL